MIKRYEVRITGGAEDSGVIGLRRLRDMLDAIEDVAIGALHFRLFGSSRVAGRLRSDVAAASEIQITDIKKGSTVLRFEARQFSDTLAGMNQLPLWENASFRDETPMSMVLQAVKDSKNWQQDGFHRLDRNLVEKVKTFGSSLKNGAEKIVMSAEGSGQEVELSKADIEAIVLLEATIPKPRMVFISGKAEKLEWSTQAIVLQTEKGAYTCNFDDRFSAADIAKLWGSDVTISGKAEYDIKGRIDHILIHKISEGIAQASFVPEPYKRERYLNKQTAEETRLRKAASERLPKWPGDETLQELLADLRG